MATLIDIEQLRTDFPFILHNDVSDDQLQRSLISASARLKKWIGESAYSGALGESATVERRLVLENAEGHLTIHYALLGLHTNFRSFGLVKSEQVEGNTVNQYFNPAEVANFSNQYLELAREIAEPYLISDGTPSATFEIVT